MTEFKNIDEYNKLNNREIEVIDNINKIDTSIFNIAAYNVLHDTFYLKILQLQTEQHYAVRFLTPILKKLSRNLD